MHIKVWFPAPCQSKLGGIYLRDISLSESEGPGSLFVMEQCAARQAPAISLGVFVGRKEHFEKPQVIIGARRACGARQDHRRQPAPHYALLR